MSSAAIGAHPPHLPVDLAHVWRAGELGGLSLQTVATGYASLDQVLPGNGWPHSTLSILHPNPLRLPLHAYRASPFTPDVYPLRWVTLQPPAR